MHLSRILPALVLSLAVLTPSPAPALMQQAYLKSDPVTYLSAFGRSMAASGNRVVIGSSSSSSPCVFVFERNGATWTQQARLQPSNSAGFSFGQSVAISGDLIIVGAPEEANNASGVNGNQAGGSLNQSGAAYIYAWNGTAWFQEAYVKASNPAAIDRFGTAVAISGTTVAIGAPREDSNATGIGGNQADNTATDSGAVYVFTRIGGVWSQEAYIKASNTQANDSFGFGLALAGDTLAVGAYGEDSNAIGIGGNQADNSATDSGAAHVFTRSGGVWSQQAYLKASNTGASDQFGTRLSISGQTLVVGATGEDSNATGINGNQADNTASDSGAAYVFTRSGTVWTQQAYLKASNTQSSDAFATSVAILDDTIVIGATGEDSSAATVNGDQNNNSTSNSGSAYVFARTSGNWSQTFYLKPYNPDIDDNFGQSVALMADGVLVGAPQEDGAVAGVNANYSSNGLSGAGAAYAFSTTPGLPEIAAEFPTGTDLVSSTASVDFGLFSQGGSSVRQFTIRNPGGAVLSLTGTSFTGSNAADFTVTVDPPASLATGNGATISVRFQPAVAGTRSATLQIASNDANENPFLIQLTGRSLSFSEDSDSDGLSDGSEFDMTALGFDWQVSQTSLVNTLFSNANGANLYTKTQYDANFAAGRTAGRNDVTSSPGSYNLFTQTQYDANFTSGRTTGRNDVTSNPNAYSLYNLSQIQALNVNTPLLTRDSVTGKFKLTIGLRKSSNLVDEGPFPMSPAQTTINAQGKLEFEFDGPGDAAFFRVGAQ